MITQYTNFEKSNYAIVTIAIWEKYAKKSWKNYCNKYKLNLFVITEHLISYDHKNWKKPTWQKLLIGDTLKKLNIKSENICYLDTDILISPNAKNIFESYNSNSYGLVSKIKNLPFDLHTTLRKVAFFRNRFVDNTYPLDLALFMPLEKIYEYSNLSPQINSACAGVVMFNIKNHA